MKADSGRVFVLPAVFAAAIAACSSQATPIPPAAQGGCHPVGDASCRNFAVGAGAGGSGSTGPDSGEPTDAGVDVELTDGSLCSPLDFSLAATYPACAACLAAGQDSGSASCCMADTNCFSDPLAQCASVVGCELTCMGGGAACGCGMFAGASVDLYRALQSCAASACASVCGVLQPVMAADM